MSTLWPKIKIWTRIVLVALLLLYLIAFLAKNSGKTVNVWYWYNSHLQSSLLLFGFATFIVGFVAALLVTMTVRTVSHLRQLHTPETQTAKPPRREENAKKNTP